MLTRYRPHANAWAVLSPQGTPLRGLLSTALHGLSRRLDRLALRLCAAAAEPAEISHAPLVEFHAEAGAPDGALYIDGLLVGHLSGVLRL